MEYIKQFETHNEYETYIASEDYVTPNVSYCEDNEELHFSTNNVDAISETRVVGYLNITTPGTYPIIGYYEDEEIEYYTDYFTEIEIDGVVLDEITGTYEFDEVGSHVIKYTLADPTVIGESAFEGIDLENITIPETVTTIGDNAFKHSNNFKVEGNLTLIIPNNVLSIGVESFYNYQCNGTFTIFVGSHVLEIGDNAFSTFNYNCAYIFYFFSTRVPEISYRFINWTPYRILVPPTSVSSYKDATGFNSGTFASRIYSYTEFDNETTTPDIG